MHPEVRVQRPLVTQVSQQVPGSLPSSLPGAFGPSCRSFSVYIGCLHGHHFADPQALPPGLGPAPSALRDLDSHPSSTATHEGVWRGPGSLNWVLWTPTTKHPPSCIYGATFSDNPIKSVSAIRKNTEAGGQAGP